MCHSWAQMTVITKMCANTYQGMDTYFQQLQLPLQLRNCKERKA